MTRRSVELPTERTSQEPALNRELLRPVTEADVDAYARDGVVCLRGMFDGDWIELLAAGFDRVLANPSEGAVDHAPEEGPKRVFSDFGMWQRDGDFQRFAFDSPAPEIVARLMRSSKVNFFFDTAWVKEPGTGKRTTWHQDQPYYQIDGDQTCGIWLPIDPISRENALHCVRGSHRWGVWFDPTSSTDGRSFYDNSPYDPAPEVHEHPKDYDVAAWDIEPGDCIVFHGLTLHGSSGNASRIRRRRALSTVWLGDDIRFGERPGRARPYFEGTGLDPGDPMDCNMFPCVWPRSAG